LLTAGFREAFREFAKKSSVGHVQPEHFEGLKTGALIALIILL
jgi:hypothetical protein